MRVVAWPARAGSVDVDKLLFALQCTDFSVIPIIIAALAGVAIGLVIERATK